MGRGKLILSYPHGGSVTTPFHESVMRFQRQDFYTERVLEGGISAGGCLVEDNREAIAQGFLNYKSPMRFGEEPNWLVCLDTDIKFDPEIIYGLLDAADPVERPIVTALYFTTISDNFTACWMRKNPADNDYVTYISVDPGLNRINACGLGCAIIHRSVLEKIKAKYENTDSFTWFGRNRVQLLKSGWTRLGEDVTFPVDMATPVLDQAWRWHPIGEFSVGDEVLSVDETSPPYSSRRFQRSVVERVIEKRLPRLRVITDEQEFVTTSEHPWLAKSGLPGDDKRAWRWIPSFKLQPAMVLASAITPSRNPDLTSGAYAGGYVQGLLHSDGTRIVGRDGRTSFVVRMKDTEPLERMATMLAILRIPSVRGPAWWDGDKRHAAMHRLGVYYQSYAREVDRLWQMAEFPSETFAAGYLAGMFDGDGSNWGDIRIHSHRESYKDRLEAAARLIGVPFQRRDAKSVCITDRASMWTFFQRTLPALGRRTFPLGQLANRGGRSGAEVFHRPVRIRAIERLPVGDVRCLQTSSGTFLADGLISHNCARAESVGATIWGHSDLRVGHFKVREENAETMKERLDARRLAELEAQASVIDAEKVRQAAVDVFYVQGEKRGFINGSGYKGEFGDHA
jgi:hypothetical protein